MEVSYNTVRGSLSVIPDLKQDPEDPSSSCFLLFDGVGLTEDGLKDWLRLCAKQVPKSTNKHQIINTSLYQRCSS